MDHHRSGPPASQIRNSNDRMDYASSNTEYEMVEEESGEYEAAEHREMPRHIRLFGLFPALEKIFAAFIPKRYMLFSKHEKNKQAKRQNCLENKLASVAF